jgi:hypothetical protein
MAVSTAGDGLPSPAANLRAAKTLAANAPRPSFHKAQCNTFALYSPTAVAVIPPRTTIWPQQEWTDDASQEEASASASEVGEHEAAIAGEIE